MIESRRSSAAPGELGGILLGQSHFDAGKPTLVIEGFVPVPCNYGEHLSDKDKWLFKEQLGRWHFAPENKLYAVGYYRTRKPEDAGIGAQDLALAREFFAKQTAVLLHIKQLPSETCVGGFVFRESGQIDRIQELTFPYGRDAVFIGETILPPLPGGSWGTEPLSDLQADPEKKDTAPAPDKAGVQQPETGTGLRSVIDALRVADKTGVQQPEAGVAPAQGTSQAPQTPLARETALPAVSPPMLPGIGGFPGRRRYAAVAVLKELNWARVVSLASLAFVLGFAGYWTFWRTREQSAKRMFAIREKLPLAWVRQKTEDQPDAQTIAGLALEVVKEKGLLRLKWNKSIPLIASASGAILVIKDGFRQNDFHLDHSRLRGGTFDYAPRTGDVTFRLRVRTPEGESSEWVRVKGVDRSPARFASGEKVVIKPHSRGWAGPGIRKKDSLATGSKSMVPGVSIKPSSVRIAHAAAHGPILVPNKAPSALRGEGIGVGAPDAGLPSAKGTEPGALEAAAVKADQPDRQPQGIDVARSIPEPRPLAGGETAGSPEPPSQSFSARSLLRITGNLAPGMRPLVPAGTKVEVKLHVDKTGRVVRAEPVTKGSADPYAMKLALHAAHELRFHPAQRDGQDVESETVIEFEFPDQMQ